MNSWIAIINVSSYAIFTAIEKLKKHTFSWGVKNKEKFKIGDIVYLYLGAPLKLVKYKCKIVDIFSKNERKPINDDIYVFDEKLNVGKSDEFINVKLIKKIDTNELSKTNIEKHGFKFNQTTMRKIDNKTKDYIESIIKG